MKPTKFEGQNIVLGAPKGKEGTVQGLPAFRSSSEVISCWKLDALDIENIQKEGRVWLRVMGHSMPPVSISTETPFIETPFDNPRRDVIGALISGEIAVKSWGISQKVTCIDVEEYEFEYILRGCIKSDKYKDMDWSRVAAENSEICLMTDNHGIVIVSKVK